MTNTGRWMEVRLKKLFIALDLVEFENYGEIRIRIRIRFSPVNSRYYHCLQILFKTPSDRYTYMCECKCVCLCVCVYLVLIAFSQFIRLIRMSFEIQDLTKLYMPLSYKCRDSRAKYKFSLSLSSKHKITLHPMYYSRYTTASTAYFDPIVERTEMNTESLNTHTHTQWDSVHNAGLRI